MIRRHLVLLLAASTLGVLNAAPLNAAIELTPINQNLLDNPFEFCVTGNCFTFTAQPFTGFGEVLGIRTSGTATVSSVFGSPSVSFAGQGGVSYGPDTLGGFTAVPEQQFIRFSNGENFLGLRVTDGGQDFYGFAYTTNQTLNGIGFETAPGTAITATTNFPAAVAPIPEPATWAMTLLGFAAIGGALRHRKRAVRLSYS